jgi:plasmid stabilization system protein ParE
MNLRLTPRALREAKRINTWWRRNRLAARDRFEDELEEALERIVATPTLGTLYERASLDVPVLRVLLPKTENHVYYAVEATLIVVLSVWGAPRKQGPKL